MRTIVDKIQKTLSFVYIISLKLAVIIYLFYIIFGMNDVFIYL